MDFPRRKAPLPIRLSQITRRLFSDWQVVGCVAAAALVCTGIGAILVARPLAADDPAPDPDQAPRFSRDGELIRPEGIEKWVFVGASIGLSYSDVTRTDGPGLFHNVYITPSAYDTFLRTHAFPDGTMLAMTLHEPGQKVAPSRHGYFEGEREGFEVAVKDTSRFPGGWAYFGFGAGRSSASPAGPSCRECHSQHAATDNVFTQFYPILRDAHEQ